MRISDWSSDVCSSDLRRGIEFDLLPWCAARSMPVMAYSPLEQGRLAGNGALAAVARRHGATEMQTALAWVLGRDGVIAIPKAAHIAHVRDNRAALDLKLTAEDRAELDRAFPPPRGKRSEEHTSELQSLMRISYAVFCWKKK